MRLTLILLGLSVRTAWPQPAMPSWLVNYAGAAAEIRSAPELVESTYEAAAKPVEVMGHYRKLFEAAGLEWHPNLDGVGSVIRASATECDLLLKFREQGGGTWVRVSCAAKAAAPAPAPAKPAEPPKLAEPSRDTPRKRLQGMEKYDQPYRPPPKPPAPRLVWPAWLVGVDGAPLTVEKGWISST
jgi:hypothetical protein